MEGGAVGQNFEMGLPKDYPSQIWFRSFREDLSVIFYKKKMPNLHNLYKSTKRKISQKNSDYM